MRNKKSSVNECIMSEERDSPKESRKSYFSPDFYAMKDILHHAHTRKEKQKRQPQYEDELYSDKTGSNLDKSLLINQEMSNTYMNTNVPWKYRRNPIFGLQYAQRTDLKSAHDVQSPMRLS